MVAGNINTPLDTASSAKAYARIRNTGLYFTTQNAFKAPKAQEYVKQLFEEAPKAKEDVKGKLAIVTGVTVGGAGYHMAEELALSAEMHVIIMGRTETKLKAAMEAIQAEAKTREIDAAPTLYEIKYDLDSLDSAVSAAEAAIKIAEEKYNGKLCVLMNNAGAAYPNYGVSKEGVESNTGRNFLAPHLLTEKLLPSLRKAATDTYKPRVVHVASLAHCTGPDYDPKRMLEKPAEGGAPDGIYETVDDKLEYSKSAGILASTFQYGRAKMAVLAECVELAKRESTLAVVSLHPGSIASNFGADLGVGAWIYYKAFGLFQFSPSQGARAALRGCLDPDLNTGELPSGSYLHSDGNPWVPENPTCVNPDTGKAYTMDEYGKATFDAADELIAKLMSK